jgi:hypothetical protein
MNPIIILLSLFLGVLEPLQAQTKTEAFKTEPDWSKGRSVLIEGNANPYGWSDQDLEQKITAGRKHALQYPVTVTGLLMPARTTIKFLEAKPGEPLFAFMKWALGFSSDFSQFNGFWDWIGLSDYPEVESSGSNGIPFPNGVRPDYPMGVSIIQRSEVEGFTLSCAACHSSEFFGHKILGMTNRFPRSNLFFVHGKSTIEKVSPLLFQVSTGSTAAETKMYRDLRDRNASIGLKRPQTLGLDTSLSQVALSLARRELDGSATRSAKSANHPRPNLLDDLVADSKPAVWWNVKYKSAYLSDGSVVSGNPVFTNFLWNEIGRGVDLPPLVDWLQNNSAIVEELTTAVFASTAPKWSELFGAHSLNIVRAKRGQALFETSCSKCHGQYEKNWDAGVDTIAVRYFEKTKTYNVGTDPGRAQGMKALADALNPLDFSKRFDILIETQSGYVAPPLDGIFIRYPYFHNNSIPNLCALMTPPEKRPVIYYSGKPLRRDVDYSMDCVGYPVGDQTPADWRKNQDALFDTRRAGLSANGHYDRIFRTAEGTERFSPDQKQDLIEFLKTL